MVKAQFNVRVDPALAAKLRREAQRRQQTPGVLVAEAIELLLSGNSSAPGPAPDGLAAALSALEQRVVKLEQQRPAASARPAPAAPPAAAALPELEAPAEAITTVELAERTGTNRAAWNNWAAKAAAGDVRHHPQAGAWRLAGKAPTPGGGPERWLWEPA
jgi:predicted transcriptional regulator